jgi:hypothetical protein
MLVVDLLHEFELGVWKALFTHLIRILYAAAPNGSLVAELDRRYVNLSTVSHRKLISFPITTGFGPSRHLAQAQSGVLQRMPQK